jgi:hypothetical protein
MQALQSRALAGCSVLQILVRERVDDLDRLAVLSSISGTQKERQLLTPRPARVEHGRG